VEDALVQVNALGAVYEGVTGADGTYLIEDITIGSGFTMNVQTDCYNVATAAGVEVLEDQTTTVDFQLLHPEMALSDDELVAQVAAEDSTTLQVTLSNEGNGSMDWSLDYAFQETVGGSGPRFDDELDDPWDELFTFNLDDTEERNRGLTFDGMHFWVSGSDNFNSGPNKLYKYSAEGELLDVFDQPVTDPSFTGFYGITFSDGFLYGVDNGTMYEMSVDEDGVEMVDSWEVPVNPARYICHDVENDWFWVGDLGTDIKAVDRDGTVQRSFGQGFYPRGATYFQDDPNGYQLYFICRDPTDPTVTVRKMDTESGQTMTLHSFEDDGTMMPMGADVTYLWNPLVFTFMTMFDNGAEDRIQLWELNRNTAWISSNPTYGTVEAGGSVVVDVTLRGSSLPEDTYEVLLEFTSNACPSTMYVDVQMDVVADLADSDARPLEWAFDGVYPNPFNPTTTVNFSLKENAMVNARVYNLLGQQVAVLAQREMSAGMHTLSFDGKELASGIYFLRFEAGPLRQTSKMILMK
jgi:hypothetical protein